MLYQFRTYGSNSQINSFFSRVSSPGGDHTPVNTGGVKSGAGADKTDNHSQPRNHLVRVVSISQDGLTAQPGTSLLDATIRRLDQSSSFRPDIACLPETFTRGEPESIAGPTIARLSNWARKNACWIICPILIRSGQQVFNSAVLLDRQGSVVGRYDKIRPTETELQKSICPGIDNPQVFQTDFGTIGIQICFDVNWHTQWQRLKQQGAQIVFFPSAYPAARQIRTLAWLNQSFVVTSTKRRAASIFDITGDVIDTTGKFRHWVAAELPVGKRLFETDFHVEKMRKIEEKYGRKVRVTWYHDDDLVSLASLVPNLTVEELISEFDLTLHTAYIQRAQQVQDKNRPK